MTHHIFRDILTLLLTSDKEVSQPEDHRVLTSSETYVSEVAEDTTARPRSRSTHRDPHRESHPLPPLPPPLPSAPAGIENGGLPSRPNTAGSEPAPHVPLSPQSHQFIPRARGASVRSEISSIPSSQASQQHSHQAQLPLPPQPLLINPSTTMGTIFQRRNKSSAPPSASGTSSPTESTSSRLTAVSLPGAGSATSLGRSRASSQPGRRPSTADRIVGSSAQHPFPPPLSAGINSHSGQGMGPAAGIGGSSSPTLGGIGGMPGMPSNRKGSKLNPNAPPSITVNTALVSPPLPSSTLALMGNGMGMGMGMGGGFGGMGGNGATPMPLVPPPPIPHASIPQAPQSPLPPMAPPDPLRKPYHMMGLLRKTMTSRTGRGEACECA
ncbi:hypothetical protein NLI96_g13264 [Meripilus lineatus]|uniref:Uncharacterized protein n=1 Tax=Meripilus lineatus TaxID=2056292 RepID=A0AAD5UNC3_9APHY|nr:hypothetical protein NLI96_g13264 [Physisporinus lineatus]